MNDDTTKTPGTASDSLTAVPSAPVLPPRYTLADDQADDQVDDGTGGGPASLGPVPGATTPPSGPAVPKRVRPGIRVRTVVLGLVVLAISATSLVSELTGIRVNGGAVALTLLIGAGAALVCGGLATALKETRRGRQVANRA